MKSVIVTPDPVNPVEKPFPKLMISQNGLVALFATKDFFVLINHNDPLLVLGSRVLGYNYSEFTDFNGTIQLSND